MDQYQNGLSGVLTLFGLLQHEHKTSVLHFSMTRHPSFEGPVKSKDPLIIYSGFRSLVAKPVYSQVCPVFFLFFFLLFFFPTSNESFPVFQNTPGSKHKFERYFQPGRNSVATIYGPVSNSRSSFL